MKQKRQAAGRKRQPSPLVVQRHEARLERIRALTAAPPFWADRRLWASLRFVAPPPGPQQRLLREPPLLGPPNGRLHATRPPTRSTPPNRAGRPRGGAST
jgi:hypothetical protein